MAATLFSMRTPDLTKVSEFPSIMVNIRSKSGESVNMKADNSQKLLIELEKVLTGVAKAASKDQRFLEKVKATLDTTLGNLYKKPEAKVTKEHTNTSPRSGR